MNKIIAERPGFSVEIQDFIDMGWVKEEDRGESVILSKDKVFIKVREHVNGHGKEWIIVSKVER